MHDNIRKIISIVAILSTLLAFCNSGVAQEADGSQGTFLKLGVGARPLAMGGAYVGLANGPASVYWNPAALGYLRKPQFEFMASRMPLDRSFNFATGTFRVAGLFGLGVSWIGFNDGGIEARSGNSVEPDFVFSNNQNVALVSVGRKINSFVSLGANVKVIRSSLESVSATGLGFDAAVLFQPNRRLSMGLLVQDIGTSYRWESGISESVPMSVRVGAAYSVLPGVLLSADFVRTESGQNRVYMGSELRPVSSIPLRIGWNQHHFSGGAGLDFPLSQHALELNYAYAYDNVLNDAIHRVSLVFRLGSRSSEAVSDITRPAPKRRRPVQKSKSDDEKRLKIDDRAVVLARVLNVREGPGTSFKRIARVYRDEVFRVKDKTSVWVQILLKNGKLGWVHGNYITKF